MEQTMFIVGVPTERVWSLASTFTHKDTLLGLTLTVESDQGDAALKGREVLHEIQTWFERDVSREDAISYFARLRLPQGVELSLWYQDATQSLFTVSHGGAGIIRRGAFFPLIHETTNLQTVQGKLEPDDVVIFGTRKFWMMYVSKLASSSDPERLVQSFSHASRVETDPSVSGFVSLYHAAQRETIASQPVVFELPKSNIRKTNRTLYPHMWIQLGPQAKKIAISALVGAIVVSGIVGIQRFSLSSRQRRIDAVLKPLESRYTTIVASVDDRVIKERNILELLQDAQNAGKNNITDVAIRSKLDDLTGRINHSYREIARRTELDHLNVFYDFRLITADFVASAVYYDEPGKLAVFLDTAHTTIVSLALEKKQPQSLSLSGDIGSVRSLSIADRKAYVLASRGIYEVSLPLDTQGRQVASPSSEWKDPSLIGNFGSNLYLFDAQARQVFRYDRGDLSASPTAWLKTKEGVELEKITSLSIDGDLWMGTSIGQVYKFTRGDRVSFRLLDILKPPESAISLYTADTVNSLYILEPRAERLLVFEKSGKYLRTIACPDFAAATSFVVDEAGKRAYILAGSLVYVLEL